MKTTNEKHKLYKIRKILLGGMSSSAFFKIEQILLMEVLLGFVSSYGGQNIKNLQTEMDKTGKYGSLNDLKEARINQFISF